MVVEAGCGWRAQLVYVFAGLGVFSEFRSERSALQNPQNIRKAYGPC